MKKRSYYCNCCNCGITWIVYPKPIRCPYCESANFELHSFDEQGLKQKLRGDF